MKTAPRIFISAAEASADLYGALLIGEVTRLRPDAEFVGVAGPAMQSAGCRPIADLTSHAAMLLGILGNLRRGKRVLRRAGSLLSNEPFDAAALIDSPMLHLPLARRARSAQVPVMYYVAPQVWAWGAARTKKIRARVDRLAVILPFEEPYFRNQGVDATYVGHPLFDALAARPPDADAVQQLRATGGTRLALLPGSRRHVVKEVLPGQLEVASRIGQRFPDLHVGVSVAGDPVAHLIEDLTESSPLDVSLHRDGNAELLAAADLTLVASGTATLEVAHYGSPMIVMYKASRLMYHLFARHTVRIKKYSLINILAGRTIVPEFMPYYTSTAPIAASAIDLLASAHNLKRMRQEIRETIEPIRQPGASARAARLLVELADARSA